jgi:hypothetical protein
MSRRRRWKYRDSQGAHPQVLQRLDDGRDAGRREGEEAEEEQQAGGHPLLWTGDWGLQGTAAE